MRPTKPVTRTGRTLLACAASAALATVGLAASPASAVPAKSAAATQVKPGDVCTAADLGTRRPYIKTTEVTPEITHFKGWYVTQGTTGYQSVTTSTQTTISVSVGLNGNVQGSFAVETLGTVGASLGLNVQVNYSSTSSESNTVTWNFSRPGYYGVYKGTKKVTGTYGSLNCNRSQQGDGSWALRWIEGPGSGSFTTYTTLEEGAVRCEDTVPPNSIMAKARSLLDCASPTAKAGHPAGAVAPTAKQTQDRLAQRPAPPAGTSAEQPKATGRAAQAALTCQPGAYRIDVPGKPLNWSAPLLANDGIRLRVSTIFSAHLDNWRLCDVTENNGVLEATLWNWGNGGCATVPANIANQEQAHLTTATCAEDDLQRFYIYRDVPGSAKIGVQNKYTGSMMGHDRYGDGELIRQYSSGRQDGTGTYTLTGV
ncbi:hypothetical protein E2C00_19395 [Streptomyces sp. WAC05374]|uniref:hypothetical protein n=1 Tax=Streptomyces sp. WAC05374 TaxID=2487420 RepID=UPI000F88A625|nr:hypothetical protein [Streptomyces sp. WAC05374]RST11379.1 hypothetical protein EF905_25285 [Streptomyces sp. WAC05374]TDF37872.1 hypothetical protein E2B92_28600 [Streptomyces sp. WAC05374]TDF52728.1 hypothetical protein E2C02_20865 [Streptomyces sp. WAC05374]TDF54147.1 hypothetical protein E2C00_19395 [Streptomyces sp. WAC05374]